MATLKNHLKESLNRVLRPLGWEFERHVKFGRELFEDIHTISKGRAYQTVFDVGGHHGQTAQRFSGMFPEAQVYSFEPFEESYAILQKATADLPRVNTFHLGLSDAPSDATLYLNRGSATNSLLPNATEGSKYQPQEFVGDAGMARIHLTTLDAFCAERDITAIDLLKIDTQGAEMRVLRGAREMLAAGRVAILYCEILLVPMYEGQATFAEIHDFLGSVGFHLAGLYEIDWTREHRMMYCEGLFFHPGTVAKRFGV